MPEIARLQLFVDANTTQATQGLRRLEGQTNNFVNRAGATLVGFLTRDLIRGTMAAAAGLFQVGAGYQDAMNIFQATSKASGMEMDQVSAKARQLGMDLTLPKTSARDAAEAMTELAKGGLSVAESMEAARGALLLSTAAGMEEARAAEVVVTALNAFGLAGHESARIANLLAAASVAASGDVEDMAQALKYASAGAALAKIPIDDVMTSISLMAQKGILGTMAGTAFRQMLLRLENPTSRTRAIIKELGIELFDSSGKMKNMRDIVEQFSGAMGNLDDKTRQQYMSTIFGTRAQLAGNFVLLAGVDAWDKMSNAVHRNNAAQELAEARSKGVKGGFDALVSRIEDAAIVLFKFVQAPLRDFLIGMAEVVPKVMAFGRSLVDAVGPAARQIGETLLEIARAAANVVSAAAPVAGIFLAIAGAGVGLVLRGILDVLRPLATLFSENEVAASLLAGVLLSMAGLKTFYILSAGALGLRNALADAYLMAGRLNVGLVAGLGAAAVVIGGIAYAYQKSSKAASDLKAKAQGIADGITEGASSATVALVRLHSELAIQKAAVDNLRNTYDGSEASMRNAALAVETYNATLANIKGVEEAVAKEVRDAAASREATIKSLSKVVGEESASQVASMNLTVEEIKEMEAAAKAVTESAKGSFAEYSSVVAAFADSVTVSGQQVINFYKKMLTDTEKWASNIKELIDRGVNKGIVQQFVEAGPKSAAAAAGMLEAVKQGGLNIVNQAYVDSNAIVDDTIQLFHNAQGPLGTAGWNAGAAWGVNASNAARANLSIPGIGPSASGQEYGGSRSTPGIQQYSRGGVIMYDQLARLHAPEVVIPMNDPERARQLMQQAGLIDMLQGHMQMSGGSGSVSGGGGGGDVYITVQGHVTTEKQLVGMVRGNINKSGKDIPRLWNG